MNFYIYCNDKNINHNYKEALLEFEKRLQAYCKITLKLPSNFKLNKETVKTSHHYLLIKKGNSTYSSEEFSEKLEEMLHSGKSTVHVFIGFTEECFYKMLSEMDLNILPTYLSFCNSTFDTQIQTLLFYEQLYRGYTIIQGKTYHK